MQTATVTNRDLQAKTTSTRFYQKTYHHFTSHSPPGFLNIERALALPTRSHRSTEGAIKCLTVNYQLSIDVDAGEWIRAR